MTFWKTVGAYLTGWLIAQPTYNRLRRAWSRRELANPTSETQAWMRAQASAMVDEIERRRSAAKRDNRCYCPLPQEIDGSCMRCGGVVHDVHTISVSTAKVLLGHMDGDAVPTRDLNRAVRTLEAIVDQSE